MMMSQSPETFGCPTATVGRAQQSSGASRRFTKSSEKLTAIRRSEALVYSDVRCLKLSHPRSFGLNHLREVRNRLLVRRCSCQLRISSRSYRHEKQWCTCIPLPESHLIRFTSGP